MPPSRTGRRPNRSDSGPMTNWPTPKPTRNIDSTICGRLADVMWKADAMFGSAGSIMSIASGLSAMMDAITITNSGKPIGRWPEAAKALALVSDNKKILLKAAPYGFWCAAQITFSAWQTIGQRGLKRANSIRPEDPFGPQAKGVVLIRRLLYPLLRTKQRPAFERRPCVGTDLEDRHAQERDGTGAD